MKISVITPSYNRAYILEQCYASLCAQTSGSFEWIVVDDGSTDNTEATVRQFIDENKIDIKYIRQPNGGKHRAHNTAVANATGELTVCLDSDDQLAPDAIETAIKIWTEASADPSQNAIGILAPRGNMDDHSPICSPIPDGLRLATMTQLRDTHGFEGDTVLFFDTQLLKKHPFREFEGEKFLTEGNLYCELDQHGPMLLLNNVLYYCEYRPDGLTAKYHKLLYDNPIGSADTYYRMSIYASSAKFTLKYAIISQAYNRLLPKERRIKFEKKRIIMRLASLFAPFFTYKYFKPFRK